MIDVTKCHLLGEVEWAQHNFARLRPLLYSMDGKSWEGSADRGWFPHAGLVFSLAPDLRYAPAGSLWTFQVKPNERQTNEEGKDVYMTIQVKPASRFITDLDTIDAEELRALATVDGFDPGSPIGGVLLPEADDVWILATDLERDENGLARVTNDRQLSRMRVLEGMKEDIAGMPTADGRWALPVINSGHGHEIRNWRRPAALAEQLAGDLRRWIPHGPSKVRAQAAAAALRDIGPHLDGLAALRSNDAKAALDRVISLVDDAEALTEATAELIDTLLTAPAVAEAIEAEKAAMRSTLEAEALASAERLEADARARLADEQRELRAALDRDGATLSGIRAEIATASAELEAVRKRQRTETATFTKSLEALIARARSEPAAYAAEWLSRRGLDAGQAGEANSGAAAAVGDDPVAGATLGEAALGRALMLASPISNDGLPLFLIMDAAIRARELVVGIGPFAREAIETWLATVAPLATRVGCSDPTMLAFADLLPSGSRGRTAPLAAAIARAERHPDRPVVALLDDVDPAAGAYWLPEAARAVRQPGAQARVSRAEQLGAEASGRGPGRRLGDVIVEPGRADRANLDIEPHR